VATSDSTVNTLVLEGMSKIMETAYDVLTKFDPQLLGQKQHLD
jgi:hypothetical protein